MEKMTDKAAAAAVSSLISCLVYKNDYPSLPLLVCFKLYKAYRTKLVEI